MKTLPYLLLLLMLAASTTAQGRCAAPIDLRQANQAARMHAGLAQGDLTVLEGVRLGAQAAHIRRVEARYRSNDGRLGALERCDLNRRLDAQSQRIFRQRHDAQRRW